MALFLLLLACSVHAQLGTTLQYGSPKLLPHMHNFPLTAADALQQGWAAVGPCVAGRGVPHTVSGAPVSKGTPVTLFFTAQRGAFAGLLMTSFTAVQAPLLSGHYWNPGANGTVELHLATRSADECCGALVASANATVGDRVVINPSTANFEVPLNEAYAAGALWTKGACVSNMGRHWAFDIRRTGTWNFEAQYLAPVVPMYDVYTGGLTGVFITTYQLQPGHYPNSNFWEIPVPGPIQCMNFEPMLSCMASTTGLHTAWCNLHIMFVNPPLITCP